MTQAEWEAEVFALSMSTLAANLATAGALCAAYEMGCAVGECPHAHAWYPGCGRAWEGAP